MIIRKETMISLLESCLGGLTIDELEYYSAHCIELAELKRKVRDSK